MKRLSKILCIVLSFMLLVNLAGAEVLATDNTDAKSEAADASNEAGNINVTENVDNEEDSKNTYIDTEDVKDTDAAIDEKKAEDTEDTQAEDSDQFGEKEVQAMEEDTLSENPVTVEVNSERTEFTVKWSAVSGAVKYKTVLYDENESVVTTDTIDTISKTFTADNANVKVGVVYKVKVFPIFRDSESSEPIGGAVPVVLLAKPEATATPAVGEIKVDWNEVEGATSYLVNNKDNKNETSYTAKGLTSGKTYTYSIKAIAELTANNNVYTYESEEVSVSATVKYAIPGKVSGLIGMDGEKSAILTWNNVSGASSYNVLRYNSSKKSWDVIKKNVKTSTYTDTKLKQGMKYQYRVAAVNAAGESGAFSDTVTVSVKNTPGTKVRTIGYKAIVKSRAPIFTSKKGKKRVKYLKKGTRITTTDYGSGRYEFKLSDGKTYWISKDRLTLTASVWTTKDYSTKTKTDFVNKKKYSSPTKYLIWINQYTQKVMIYTGKKGNWKLIRSCKCATGTHLHFTPRGVFKITYKEKGWFYKTTYEKPIVHFKDANSFHSRIKNYKGGYADATIGKPRSKGCVRLYDKDIVFIYKNCPKGTTVVSH